MATLAPPTRRHVSFLHRHSNNRLKKSDSYVSINNSRIFEGTDAVPQKKKAAVQRVVEIYNALEVQHHSNTTTSAQRQDTVSVALDSTLPDLNTLNMAGVELRAFKHFLRRWDPSQASADVDFDRAIASSQAEFEEIAIKHFFQRIALWHESDVILASEKKNSRSKGGPVLGALWAKEMAAENHRIRDELKEVTTREGLAQLLWTLMHDSRAPLAPEFYAECVEAVKRKYGIRKAP